MAAASLQSLVIIILNVHALNHDFATINERLRNRKNEKSKKQAQGWRRKVERNFG